MPVWKTTPITIMPDIDLVSWRVVEVEGRFQKGKTRHFVGHNATENEGHVSSAIDAFDVETAIGTTRSGRRYHLSGKPGDNEDAACVWRAWKLRNGITAERDVTAEYVVAHREKAKKPATKKRKGARKG